MDRIKKTDTRMESSQEKQTAPLQIWQRLNGHRCGAALALHCFSGDDMRVSACANETLMTLARQQTPQGHLSFSWATLNRCLHTRGENTAGMGKRNGVYDTRGKWHHGAIWPVMQLVLWHLVKCLWIKTLRWCANWGPSWLSLSVPTL